jgi:hypothetical protein
MITNFGIKRFIEHRETVCLRPKSYAGLQKSPKIDRDSMLSIKKYLLEPASEPIDEMGNTLLHLLA